MEIKMTNIYHNIYSYIESIGAYITISLFCGIIFFLAMKAFYLALWFVVKNWFSFEIYLILILINAPILLSIFYIVDMELRKLQQEPNLPQFSSMTEKILTDVKRNPYCMSKMESKYRVQTY